MRPYRLYMRSFAPWPAFGGIAPGPTYHQSGRITTVNQTNYEGDDRGFSLDTDNSRTTARINFYIDVDPTAGRFSGEKVWSNESQGPWMLVGPIGRRRANPKATTLSYYQAGKLHLDASLAGANPLVPIAPDIDARGVFDFRLERDPRGDKLVIASDISGDQFPAFEAFIDDQMGGKVFLGGFAPESRSPLQLMRLFGQLNKPNQIYFRSGVEITLGPMGGFSRIVGTFATQLSVPFLNFPGATYTLGQWNALIMKSIPLPIDGWLY